eukprot:symbB.v1.2.025586.t1/scaffold2492.1/size77838/4
MSIREDGDTYFFDVDGNRRFGGVLSVDETPLDWRDEDGIIPPPPVALVDEEEDFTLETPAFRHFAAREVAKSKCECYWVELQDPNQEFYFYDYVTNAWCWESPPCPVVYQSIHALPAIEIDDTLEFSLGIAIEELEQRISQLLEIEDDDVSDPVSDKVPPAQEPEPAMAAPVRQFAPLPEGFTQNAYEDVHPEGHGFRNFWTNAFYSGEEEGIHETELFYSTLHRFQYLPDEPGYGGEGFWQCVLEGQKIRHKNLPRLYVKYQDRRREMAASDVEVFSHEVPGTEDPENAWGPSHRACDGQEPVLALYDEESGMQVKTSYENFQNARRKYPNKPFLGHRPIAADGSAGPYVWSTFEEVGKRSENFGSGLINLGLCPPQPDPEVRDRGMLGIYSKNRPEWVIAEQGCFTQSIVTVPMYDTLGADSVAYVVKQCGLKTMVCSASTLEMAVACKASSPSLQCIIVMDLTEELKKKVGVSTGNLQILSMTEVENAGAAKPRQHLAPFPEDILTFCYTSGTTGDPKGVLVTHENLTSAFGATRGRQPFATITGNDVLLSYLPLPHIFERMVQFGSVFGGAAIGFYQGDTLKIVDDLQALKPTIFPSVPRLLTRVHDRRVSCGVIAPCHFPALCFFLFPESAIVVPFCTKTSEPRQRPKKRSREGNMAHSTMALPSSEDFAKMCRLSERLHKRSKGEGKRGLLAALGIDAPAQRPETNLSAYSRQTSSSGDSNHFERLPSTPEWCEC